MTTEAGPFLTELEAKNQESFRRLGTAFGAGLIKEGFQIADVLKMEVKVVIEAIEVASLWQPDADPLDLKIALATRCGDGARQFQALVARLEALGMPLATFDPRLGGYSKLFAFFRSLQTTEERASAGFLTLGGLNLARLETLAAFCDEKGDTETGALYRERLLEDERRHVTKGRQMLERVVINEESQARARRSAYRTLELAGEVQDPTLMRKFLRQSVRK